MTNIGYALATEDHGPNELITNASLAEECGFSHALISDHFHPWTTTQGQAPFVWSTLGDIAETTDSLDIGVGVTCPSMWMHPAITAQAAATTATMFDGRFFVGVGTGENLNEHVCGDRWPPFDHRVEMLEEAIGVIRTLWTGETVTHRGKHYTVENARLFTLPDEEPPIYVSGTGPTSTRVAGELGDGLVSTTPTEISLTYSESETTGRATDR